MVITRRRVLQAPARRFLQGLEKRYQCRAVGGRQSLEPVACAGGLAAVVLDRLLQRRRAAVVQKVLGVAQVEQRLGAEVGRRCEAEADVREIRAHVVEQQVGVGGELLVPQGGDRAVPRAQGGHVAGGAPDFREQLAAALPVPSQLEGGGGRKQAHERVREI